MAEGLARGDWRKSVVAGARPFERENPSSAQRRDSAASLGTPRGRSFPVSATSASVRHAPHRACATSDWPPAPQTKTGPLRRDDLSNLRPTSLGAELLLAHDSPDRQQERRGVYSVPKRTSLSAAPEYADKRRPRG